MGVRVESEVIEIGVFGGRQAKPEQSRIEKRKKGERYERKGTEKAKGENGERRSSIVQAVATEVFILAEYEGSPNELHTLGADPYLPSRHIESFLRVFEHFACIIPRG